MINETILEMLVCNINLFFLTYSWDPIYSLGSPKLYPTPGDALDKIWASSSPLNEYLEVGFRYAVFVPIC